MAELPHSKTGLVHGRASRPLQDLLEMIVFLPRSIALLDLLQRRLLLLGHLQNLLKFRQSPLILARLLCLRL